MTEYLNASTRNGGVKQVVVPERTNISEVEEAPFDDQQYARVNGEWQPLFFQGSATMPTLSVEGESDLVPVLAYSLTSNVAKLYTSRPHGLSSGDDVFVSGIDATFNGAYTVVAQTAAERLSEEFRAKALSSIGGSMVYVDRTDLTWDGEAEAK